jgi:hypothetical protein
VHPDVRNPPPSGVGRFNSLSAVYSGNCGIELSRIWDISGWDKTEPLLIPFVWDRRTHMSHLRNRVENAVRSCGD